MNQQQRHTYLSAMGITVWQQRDKNHALSDHHTIKETVEKNAANISKPITNITEDAPLQPALAQSKIHTNTPKPIPSTPKTQNTPLNYAILDWPALTSTVATCQQCALAKTRNQAIIGQGSHHASLMIIGDAPADDEDRQGLPFAGKTAQLLTHMLNAIDIPPKDVYLTNLIKCRPPNNRSPYKKELKQCHGFIHQQIKLIQPDLIFVVGRVAAQHLLASTNALAQLRNKIHTLEPHNIPLIATYHPAYLLRQTSAKAKAWGDLQQVQEQLSHLNKCRKRSANAYTTP
jgi:DNA polymerase